MEALSLVALGVLLGVRHAVDPDHVIAVGTIATRTASFSRSAAIGALWGLGHTITVMAVGGTLVLLRATIAPRVALGMEFSVALMLIVLGILNVRAAQHEEPVAVSRKRPVMVGLVHGMAGSASIALLVLATIPTPVAGLMYLLCFGVGTVVGMLAVTSVLVFPGSLLLARSGLSRRLLVATSGLASVAFGVVLAYSLGGPAALLIVP